jgi:hypothetical protein
MFGKSETRLISVSDQSSTTEVLPSYGIIRTREDTTGLHKIFIFLSQITITNNLDVKIYGFSGAKDQGQINAQFSFKLYGNVGRFHGYFFTLLISGGLGVDNGKRAEGWNPI